MRILAGCLLFLVIGAFDCRSQDRREANSASTDLASLAANEAKQGVYVFYTQSFIDKENKRALYRGSVYGAIQSFEVKDCELKIEAVIVDKFSGTVGHGPTGPLQDMYRYTATLSLTSDIAAYATVIEKRPAQLGRNTHSVCEEKASCNFWWLLFRAKERVIHEISSVNDGHEFNGQVDHFVVPVSSAEVGRQFIVRLRKIADSHCR